MPAAFETMSCMLTSRVNLTTSSSARSVLGNFCREGYGETIECRLYAIGYSAKMAGEGEQNETDWCLARCDAVVMRKCDCAPARSTGVHPMR